MTPEQEKFLLNIKVARYVPEMKKLLRKHGLISRMIISFPTKKKIPFLGKVGVMLIKRTGGVIDTIFKNIA